MKQKKIKLLTFSLFLLSFCVVMFGAGCEEEELPPNHAKGRIIGVTGECYNDIVVIEVDNPGGIGISGTFSTFSGDIQFDYKNAIGVPYFSKIGISDSVPQAVGTYLYFEYRELTDEERYESNLFFSHDGGCPLNIIPPQVKRMMITKIISYK